MADRKAYDIYQPVITEGHLRASHSIGVNDLAITAADVTTTGNTVGMFKAAKGFTVTGHGGKASDMDAGAGLLITIGCTDTVGADADRFLTSSNVGQAGGAFGAIAATGIGYKFTADTEIVLTIATQAATTPAAGTVSYWLEGYFDKG